MNQSNSNEHCNEIAAFLKQGMEPCTFLRHRKNIQLPPVLSNSKLMTNFADLNLPVVRTRFAALTNAMLLQKDESRSTLQSLVDWSTENEAQLTPRQ